MAATFRARPDLQIPKKWNDRETSPERTPVWTEPPKLKSEKKVPLVYYLSRNGQLDHPHFMEVPLSSSDGLYLKDVINRLNFLRGKGMASLYAWSSKRSYKNGFVWHDLSENDFIYPAHGQEYVLKGSELVEESPISKSQETVSSSFRKPPEPSKSEEECDFPAPTRRRNQSWSSIDLHEYRVYKSESSGDSSGKASDASTQTDDKRRRRKSITEEPELEEQSQSFQNQSTELSREDISPPPSDSSPETLESLMKADGRLILRSDTTAEDSGDRTASGRMKASSVIMQLISCGSMSFKDCGPSSSKEQNFSLISHHKSRFPRGGATVENPTSTASSGDGGCGGDGGGGGGEGFGVEDKEYYSGSLIETRKDEFAALKRSSSYNADRSTRMLSEGKETAVRAKCIPRKPKTSILNKKETNNHSQISSNTQHATQKQLL